MDLIEVVERNKEGYESDIDEDEEDIGGDVEVLSDELETNSTDDEPADVSAAVNGSTETPGKSWLRHLKVSDMNTLVDS